MADDLISRSQALNFGLHIELDVKKVQTYGDIFTIALQTYADYIKALPPAIVRCKDCKYATDDDVDTTRFWCGYKWPAFMVPGDGYCFRGEREEEG